MTSKLSLFAAALAVLGGGATQALAHEGGYLPPPAYAYSQYPTYDYAANSYEGGCDAFTLAGAHAGITVLGINLDGGSRLSVGGDSFCHHHHHRRVHYAQPAPPAPPMNSGYPAYGPPQPPPMYQQPAYAPPPPMPCGCEQPPHGW